MVIPAVHGPPRTTGATRSSRFRPHRPRAAVVTRRRPRRHSSSRPSISSRRWRASRRRYRAAAGRDSSPTWGPRTARSVTCMGRSWAISRAPGSGPTIPPPGLDDPCLGSWEVCPGIVLQWPEQGSSAPAYRRARLKLRDAVEFDRDRIAPSVPVVSCMRFGCGRTGHGDPSSASRS